MHPDFKSCLPSLTRLLACVAIACHFTGNSFADSLERQLDIASKQATRLEILIRGKYPPRTRVVHDFKPDAIPDISVYCEHNCSLQLRALVSLFSKGAKPAVGCERLSFYVNIRLKASDGSHVGNIYVSNNAGRSFFYFNSNCFESSKHIEVPVEFLSKIVNFTAAE